MEGLVINNTPEANLTAKGLLPGGIMYRVMDSSYRWRKIYSGRKGQGYGIILVACYYSNTPAIMYYINGNASNVSIRQISSGKATKFKKRCSSEEVSLWVYSSQTMMIGVYGDINNSTIILEEPPIDAIDIDVVL